MKQGSSINTRFKGSTNRRIREVKSWVFVLAIPLTIILLLNLFICKVVFVSGNSMYPTLKNRDILLAWQFGYTPQVGDIILIKTSENKFISDDFIIKRIVAVSGQTVEIDYEQNVVSIDGDCFDEPYINREGDFLLDITGEGNFSYKVPDGYVFVLGDNRNDSLDSRNRYLGMVSEEDIVGSIISAFYSDEKANHGENTV